MNFWAEMVFCVVAIEKPGPILELALTAHAPSHRLVRIAAVVAVISVKVRKAMAEVIKGQQKADVAPVENSQRHKCRNKKRQLRDSPERLTRIFAFKFPINRFWIFAEETQKRVFKRMLRFAVVSMFVNRNPIDCRAVVIEPVGISLMMLHVDAFIENLAKADRDRLQDAEQTVEQWGTKVGIVNEIV
jgi:hypothetical protein